jgi:hypothetical protein
MIYRDACFSDILSVGTQRDACVVLPTLDHAVYWWPRVYDMFSDRQNVIRTKTGLALKGSHTAIRLWTPYAHEPTQPFDFIHPDVFTYDYLLLWGLSKKRDVKWML